MTVLELVRKLVRGEIDIDMDSDSPEKAIYLAYWIGREEATKNVSDQYTDLIRNMRQRAAKCRYSKMANAIIGERDYIYSTDYSQDITATFGSDETAGRW